jgi:hypothetical protein
MLGERSIIMSREEVVADHPSGSPSGHPTSERERGPRRTVPALDRTQLRFARVGMMGGAFAYVSLLVVEIVLTAGFALLLIGTDQSSGLVEFVLRISERFAGPFRGFVAPVQLRWPSVARTSVVDVELLVAMLVYGIVAIVLRAIVRGGRSWTGPAGIE